MPQVQASKSPKRKITQKIHTKVKIYRVPGLIQPQATRALGTEAGAHFQIQPGGCASQGREAQAPCGGRWQDQHVPRNPSPCWSEPPALGSRLSLGTTEQMFVWEGNRAQHLSCGGEVCVCADSRRVISRLHHG